MAKSRKNFEKRGREKARVDKQREKEKDRTERRLLAKQLKAEKIKIEGVDPDIEGIIPGPQPLPEQWGDGTEDREED